MVDPVCSDLATKAELQELRDQLNAVLGEKENGGTQEVFKAGVSGAGSLAAIGSTVYLATKDRAANAVVDLVLDNPVNEPIWRDLANGNAKWTKVKGSGARVPLPDLSKVGQVTGQAAGAGAGATAVAATASASMALLVGLVNIIGTLALNIATVKILDKRIDAEARGTQQSLDALNNGMLRLYSRNQEDIGAVQQQLNDNAIITEQNRQVMEEVRFKANEAINKNQQLNSELDTANDAIAQLQVRNQRLAQEIVDYNADYEETTENLTQTITEVDNQLQTAIQIIETQKATIQEAELDILEVNKKTDSLDSRVTEVEEETERLRVQFEKLGIDLSEDINDLDARVDDLEGKVILTEKWVAQNRSTGGSSAPATRATADAQTKLLDLTAKLGGQTNNVTIRDTNIYNNTNPFTNIFNQLFNNVGGGDVNQEQLDTLRADLGIDFSTLLTAGLTATVVPDLNRLLDRTSTDNIARGTEQGICQSLNNPSPCNASAGSTPTQGLKGMKDFLKNQADAIAAGLGLANLGANASILGIVQSTNNIVSNATTGVKATKQFLDKAWEATGADKVLNAITTALVIHNGVQLSTNLTATVTETASVVLDAMGVEDAQGNPFDVTTILRTKLNDLMTRLVGAENYAALTTKLAQFNRIYQSTANVLDSTRDLFDSAHSVAELTATNTGKIGNALLEAGVVYEDSYQEMTERINPQSKALARIEGFRDSLDSIEESVSTVSNIASEVVSTRESYGELIQTRDDWREENQAVVDEIRLEKEQTKVESQADTDLEETDFDAASEEELETEGET